jgi:hypothetical protein
VVARGNVSMLTAVLHRYPVGVVVSTSRTPSGAPALRQNAVISVHPAQHKAMTSASRTVNRRITG